MRAAALGSFGRSRQPTQNEALLHATAVPRAFRQYLRTLAHPSLRLGEIAREGGRYVAPSRLDRARLASRQLGVAIERPLLASKELLFLQYHRRDAPCLRDGLWRWGTGEVMKTPEQREWGEVAGEGARALVDCRGNRSDTGLHVTRLWDLCALPLQQFDQHWDELYLDQFPEVSDSFARPGDARWDSLYTDFTKHWLIHPSPYMKTTLGLPLCTELSKEVATLDAEWVPGATSTDSDRIRATASASAESLTAADHEH